MKNPKKIKDLDIEIKPKEQVIWERCRDDTQKMIDDISAALVIQKAILNLANEKLKQFEKADKEKKDYIN